MIKKGFYLFLGLIGLAVATVPSVKDANMKMAKADDASTFEVTGVSNQNIADGWGLGIAVEFSPYLDGAYWKAVNVSGGIHLYDAGGTEVALPAVEEVGQQLCIGRGGGTDYYGYSITFDADLSFTLSSGTTWANTAAKTFYCYGANGSTGYYWESGPKQVVKVDKVANQNIAGFAGEGISIEFTPYLDCDYWAEVNLGSKAHLIDPDGNEVSMPKVEEVGQQLCIGRGNGCDYKGYKLQFEAGLVFTLSSGTSFKIAKSITFECNAENGATGVYWDVYYDEATFEYKEDYSFGNNSDWSNFYIVFSNIPDISHYVILSAEELAIVNAHFFINGENNKLKQVLQLGGGRYEFWFKDDVGALQTGDTITISAGLPNYQYSGAVSNFAPQGDGDFFITHVLKEDLKFVYDGTAFHKYLGEPTDFTFTGKAIISVGEEAATTITITPEGTYGKVTYVSSAEGVASVSVDGKITGVSEGEATITATIGEISKSLSVTVLPEKDIKGVKFVNIYNYFSVLLNSSPSDFHPNLTTVKLIYEDDTLSSEIAVPASDIVMDELDTTVEGEVELGVKVTINGVEYRTSITVVVYDYYDQKPSEVGIVDWFAYATFIQFPNTSTNRANFTNNDYFPLSEYANKVHYTKHDGTSIPLGFYFLAENLALFPQFKDGEGNPVTLDVNNYNDYYEAGDLITIDALTPLYKWTGDIFDAGTSGSPIAGTGEAIIEGYVVESITYRYDGNVWGLYVPYTDMELSSTEISMIIGESVSAGATRVPANATTGKFTYASSNEEVATVSPNGVIKGVGEGTCTITVTLSEDGGNVKTGTISVTVKDAVVGLEIQGEAKIKKGASLEDIDLSGVEVYQVMASGKKGEKVNLDDVTITGLNTDEVGEQTAVITVTVDGKTLTGTITVTVYEEAARSSGCGGSVAAASIAVSLSAFASVALLLAKKRREK